MNKKHITVFDIPLGMCRSVERINAPQKRHPVRDAREDVSGYFLPSDSSLTGCCLKIYLFQIGNYMMLISSTLILF